MDKATKRMISGDARHLNKIRELKGLRAKTIITSPPYLDTQDYGASGQIGFGQHQEEYLSDLRNVFEQCGQLSTHDATLWLVVGPVHRAGRLIQLPEMLTTLAAEAGWIPREQITWAKGKSLPWAGSGGVRNVTEQIIMLSKSNSFMFDLSDLLSPDPASPWWRRYPERYSPLGRRPTNIWNIRIPTQGSWKSGLRHLCPFPQELTFRMISLSSEFGDTVLDPFAGIGSVPAMANSMGRLGYGVELAEQYVDRFPEAMAQSREWLTQRQSELEALALRHRIFYDTIVELRLLKFGHLIGKRLIANGYPVEQIHVVKATDVPRIKHKIVTGRFDIRISGLPQKDEVLRIATAISDKRPLSKFGIHPLFNVTDSNEALPATYWYDKGRFWMEPELFCTSDQTLHLTSDFRPRIEEVVEVGSWSDEIEGVGEELGAELKD